MRLPDPMLDIRLFRIPTFRAALLTNFLTVLVATGYFVPAPPRTSPRPTSPLWPTFPTATRRRARAASHSRPDPCPTHLTTRPEPWSRA